MAGVDTLQWLNLARHGESTGNVAHDAVDGTGAEEKDVPERDADIPLTAAGREQAAGLGRWLATLPADERPTAVVTSPYLRARETARIALARTDYAADLVPRVDERLRDRDQGVFEGLTPAGIRGRHPEEARRREWIGKFYYRPPGGESWTDLALRLRSFYRDLGSCFPGGRVLIVTHDVIIVMTRYLVEELTEERLMEIEREPVGNASISRWRQGGGGLRAVCYDDRAHLASAGSPAE
ncbi:histidine phosphatase family protein [Spirillospora albida]|uniref:histidine phosphatase family protein n=1 Tax=Spirillospora albida TaxID=58123 RepID=UPI0004BE5E5B|nr:histidine phosphatase family protein [Spirillospora albida]